MCVSPGMISLYFPRNDRLTVGLYPNLRGWPGQSPVAPSRGARRALCALYSPVPHVAAVVKLGCQRLLELVRALLDNWAILCQRNRRDHRNPTGAGIPHQLPSRSQGSGRDS